MFRTVTVVLFSLTYLSAFPQQSVIDRTHDPITKNGISITSSIQTCDDVKNGTSKEYVLLSVLNENPYPVTLSFKKNLWFDEKCNSCNSTGQEQIVSVSIEAHGTVKGSCDGSNGLRIFSQMLNLEKVRKLTDYELIDIEVHAIN